VRVVNSEIASDGVGLQVTDVGQTNAGVSVEHVSIAALYPVSVGGSIVGEGSQLAVRNSLLIGTGQGPALRLQNTNPSPFPYVGAGNALYSPGPLLVQRGLSGFVDLADWKAASGQDATSVVVAVTFEDAAAGDLRFAGPSVGDVRLGGVPWPAVPEDRLGVARSATFPTMGAYESTPSLTPTIRLFVSAYLQGTFLPSTGGLPTMRTDLSAAGRLPLAHPYGGAPWFHTGTESVEPGFFEANPAFVDWVLVGLRATPDGPDLVRRALLLHEDSGIRFGATGTVLSFPVRSGTYTVVVYHRNHLPIASTPRSLTNVLHPIDSSVRLSVPEFVLGGLSAGVQAQQGILALAAGDGDGNGSVLANDRQAVWLPTVGQTGYLSGDFNLDGSVLADDRQTLWAPNVGRQSAVPGASLAPTESAPTKTAPAPAPHRDASTSADQ
jgi:hypothetical protein